MLKFLLKAKRRKKCRVNMIYWQEGKCVILSEVWSILVLGGEESNVVRGVQHELCNFANDQRR